MSQSHPDWDQILDHVEAEREGQERAVASKPASDAQSDLIAHLSQCPHCAELVREAFGLIERLERARMHRPQARQIADTAAAVRAEFAQLAEWPRETLRARGWFANLRSGISEIWAELCDDSRELSPAMRAAVVDAQPRMLLYETDAFSITVSIAQELEEEAIQVRGQVIPLGTESIPDGSLALLRCGETQSEAPLADYGEFSFPTPCPIPPGETAQLAIALANRIVRIMLPVKVAES